MRKLIFATTAIDDIKRFKSANQHLAFKIFEIVSAIQSDPFKGIGKPEPLKGDLKGSWSRRITAADRLVYEVSNTKITIISCRFHY